MTARPASSTNSGAFLAWQKKASLAVSIALFAVVFSAGGGAAAPTGNAAFLPTPRAPWPTVKRTPFNFKATPARSTYRSDGFPLARMSVDDEVAEIAAGDSGGRVALAGVVASGSAPVRAHQTFESGSLVVDGAAGGQKDDAATVAVKRAVAALPGTWWAAGLPKWMHVVRRRMITKEDLFHVHAASGMLYLVGGSMWLLNVMGLEVFAGIPQLETSTAIPLFLLGAGLVNTLSAIPMANTRSWLLSGVCVSVIQLWYAWYVSGAYPASLAPADPWFAAAGFAVLIIGAVEAEEAIASENKARELVRKTGRRSPTASGEQLMRGDDYLKGHAISRYASIATVLFNSPHLYATLVGSGWVERLGEAYPAAPALLFHSYFALATSGSISLLAPTLYSRRLINVEGLAAMQFLMVAPVITSLVDAVVMGAAATNNPFEIYLGFLH